MAGQLKGKRNIAVFSHGGGGKTTLIERLLCNSGVINVCGDVNTGTTVMTTEPEEVARKITIFPHVGHYEWDGIDVNVVDTPGYSNFLEETRGVMGAVDGGVMILSGISGVKSESERLWEMCRERHLPVIGYVNKIDSDKSNYLRVLDEVQQSFGVKCLPLTLPVGTGKALKGIVDLVAMRAWSVEGEAYTPMEIPDDLRVQAEYYHTQLVETVVETDDDLLTAYFDGIEPDLDIIYHAILESVMTARFLPVICGSALANTGIRTLANAINRYLPYPGQMSTNFQFNGRRPEDHDQHLIFDQSRDGPFSAIVFNTNIDPYAGVLSTVRVVSGSLKAEGLIYNGTRQQREKCGHLFKLQGKEKERVAQLEAGDIGAIAKLGATHTGDTLCDEDAPIHYHRVKFPEPLLSYAVEGSDDRQSEKIAAGLKKLCEEDPTLHVHRDAVSQQLILSGMGQTHIDVTLERLTRRYHCSARLQEPAIPYRETLNRKVRVQGRLKKQTGGHGQFADCWIEAEPGESGSGFVFENHIVGGVIPKQYISAVEKGVVEGMQKGALGGFPMVDIKVSLVDGSYHSVDSSDYAFQSAGSLAIKAAMEKAGTKLLEPLMEMDVQTPEASLGDVLRDLNARRAQVNGVEPYARGQRLHVKVPMRDILNYGSALHSITAGRGLYTTHLAGYQSLSVHLARAVLLES